MNYKVLVLGGTEFVSAAIAKHLIAQGYTVDILTRGIKPLEYSGVRKHLKGDRSSFTDMENLIKQEAYDAVMDISCYEPKELLPVLKYLNKENLKRYVFCSTGGVYGFHPEIVTEDFPRVDSLEAGEYCLNKKLCEDMLFEAIETDKLPVVIFRPTYIYGEGNNLKRENYYFNQIEKNLPIWIPTEKQSQVQFIHIKDLVALFESSLKTDLAIGQAFNATCSEAVTWRAYVDCALEACQMNTEVIECENAKQVRANGGSFPFYDETYLLSNEKVIACELHPSEIKLAEGLKLAWQWRNEKRE